VSEKASSRRKHFFLGMLVGIAVGLGLGSTLAAIFGDDVAGLTGKLVKRIAGERDEPNFELLLQ